jgi:GTP cyclohydrolase I
VALAYREMLGGLRRSAPKLSAFPNTSRYAEMIAVAPIPFYSICAHHFLPFFGSARVGYVPKERLIGLSKLSRAVDHCARRPQLQENLTEQVADLLHKRLAPAGLVVCIEARHLCMEMRGVSKPGLVTTTMAVRGTLRSERMRRRFFDRRRASAAAFAAPEVQP